MEYQQAREHALATGKRAATAGCCAAGERNTRRMPSDPSASEEVAASEPGDLTTEAVDFVNRYNDEWSKDSASALAFMKGVYADEVSFFGNSVDKDVILKD